MQVKVINKIYSMSPKAFEGLLQTASAAVSLGIYAVGKGDYAELRCDKCSSVTQLKNLARRYRRRGFKVYCNKGSENERL